MAEQLLTIAIPTFNGANTIASNLGILLPQCDERVEIIISDNGSTDRTQEIIHEFMKDYPFIRYIRNEHNIGPDSNYLQCMNMAKGKYTLLLSDDDVLIEGRLKVILDFLESSEDISLVYLNAVSFRERYIDYSHCEKYNREIYDNKNFTTKDSREFMRYAGRMWGFISCFIFLTQAFRSLQDLDTYRGTNWLQTYIHILCSQYGAKRLGVIGVPCIAAGIYNAMISVDVNGSKYREMLDFAINHGFDKKQMDELFIWRCCFLERRTVIKKKAAGIKHLSFKDTFNVTRHYIRAWLGLYPFYLLPESVCRVIVRLNDIRRGYKDGLHTLRAGDVVG